MERMVSACGLVAFMKDVRMNDSTARASSKPPSPSTPAAVAPVAAVATVATVAAFPPDIARLLDVLARIELRRQVRLRAERLTGHLREAS